MNDKDYKKLGKKMKKHLRRMAKSLGIRTSKKDEPSTTFEVNEKLKELIGMLINGIKD